MFQLMTLPYAKGALAPLISEETLSFHHGAHHAGYVTTLNTLIQDTPYETASLEDIIQKTAQKPQEIKIFNNAAQVWNHDFYWHSLCPKGTATLAQGPLHSALMAAFGTMEAFLGLFLENALAQFGSGWCWLVADDAKQVSLLKTGNADLPLLHGKTALLTCDVWEHAYYLDYQNKRAAYVKALTEELWNWDFAEKNYAAL